MPKTFVSLTTERKEFSVFSSVFVPPKRHTNRKWFIGIFRKLEICDQKGSFLIEIAKARNLRRNS